jgi:hypothetical protein
MPSSSKGAGLGTAETRGMSRADAELYAKKQREFASEEGRAYREAWAQEQHKKNLHLVTRHLHSKGLWRVRLNATCEIMEVVAGAKGGPPVSGEFSFRCTSDGETPKFGSLSRLDATQEHYAKTLITDLEKVSHARELARQHQQACDAEGTGALAVGPIQQFLDSVTAKAGELPPSRSEVLEERQRQDSLAAQRKAEERKAEERAALEALGVSGADGGLDEVMARDRQKERRKAEKKARQKAKRLAAARGAPSTSACGDGGAGVDAGDVPQDATVEEAGSESTAWAAHREIEVDDEVAAFSKLLSAGQVAGARLTVPLR